jgi:hypothetical protein
MPFVKKEILDRLLKDEQNWLDLLNEREAEARGRGYETAQLASDSQVSSANQLTANANARIDELNQKTTSLHNQLGVARTQMEDDQAELHRAYTDRDLDARLAALREATTFAIQAHLADVIPTAEKMQTFLRGQADPVHNDPDRVEGLGKSVRLVNSGWNSALEYVAAELGEVDSTLGMQFSLGEREGFASTLRHMHREA